MTTETLILNIITPERSIAEQLPVSLVTLTGSEGLIQVLPGHVPMIGIIETGLFSYVRPDGSGDAGVISSGFFEINENTVNLMAETLELEGEIDLDRARAAQQKAEAMLRESSLDEAQFRKYQLKLFRSLIRQQIGGKDKRG